MRTISFGLAVLLDSGTHFAVYARALMLSG